MHFVLCKLCRLKIYPRQKLFRLADHSTCNCFCLPPLFFVWMVGDHASVSTWGVILEVPLVISSKAVDRAAQRGWEGLLCFPCHGNMHSALALGSFPISILFQSLKFALHSPMPEKQFYVLCFKEHFLTNWNPSSFLLAILPLATKCLMIKDVFRTQQFSVSRSIRLVCIFGENVLSSALTCLLLA